ncbi:hypothetical protein CSUB01_12227 [Colletotrichum sublineola]|uniref:Gag-like protein n=1 Tax=Colletotrichum sublineola TaxID=1173701 RepID=A0A066X3E9_COLSU|nr:hypothetical protein CSUB01_12227 [Colletotrichum sublineola]
MPAPGLATPSLRLHPGLRPPSQAALSLSSPIGDGGSPSKRKRISEISPTSNITMTPTAATAVTDQQIAFPQMNARLNARLGIDASMHRPKTNMTHVKTATEIKTHWEGRRRVGNACLDTLNELFQRLRSLGEDSTHIDHYTNLLFTALQNDRNKPTGQQNDDTPTAASGGQKQTPATRATNPWTQHNARHHAVAPDMDRPTAGKNNVRARSQHHNSSTDLRLFIRIPEGSPASKISPSTAHRDIARICEIQVEDIEKTARVQTGLSVTPASYGIRTTILNSSSKLSEHFGATAVDSAQTWTHYRIIGVPRYTFDYQGNQVPITEQLIADEVKMATKKIPARVHTTLQTKDLDIQTWIISLTEWAPPFRLFDSALSRQLKERFQPYQCTICFDWHGRRPCQRNQLCKKCGKPEEDHPAGVCTAPTQCTNCKGPYLSNHPECRLQPKKGTDGRISRPTKTQRQAIRQKERQRYEQARREPELPSRGDTREIRSPSPERQIRLEAGLTVHEEHLAFARMDEDVSEGGTTPAPELALGTSLPPTSPRDEELQW